MPGPLRFDHDFQLSGGDRRELGRVMLRDKVKDVLVQDFVKAGAVGAERPECPGGEAYSLCVGARVTGALIEKRGATAEVQRHVLTGINLPGDAMQPAAKRVGPRTYAEVIAPQAINRESAMPAVIE